ncbi:predicted protein [Histoplasma mississippiense (nom. inval.)]|uniref:predicted protein n=1 Tax=Ajellomyces capsulatus (strain NAm1 / WU24) TaxID=2059318 RepID=UPI000157CBF9|nr:predicted protein [Histoplasma mississippiense (nom. inval.)]EDN10285.1 predicted protein [Histoplasma mississippiense (nom. inval.)]
MVKRRTGWFAEGEDYGGAANLGLRRRWPSHELGLRQGFFTFARTLTKASERSIGRESEMSSVAGKEANGGRKRSTNIIDYGLLIAMFQTSTQVIN